MPVEVVTQQMVAALDARTLKQAGTLLEHDQRIRHANDNALDAKRTADAALVLVEERTFAMVSAVRAGQGEAARTIEEKLETIRETQIREAQKHASASKWRIIMPVAVALAVAGGNIAAQWLQHLGARP
jgi:hypothetical protein